jgi:hypothetical protein
MLPPNARMLEPGSGPGHDATFFEAAGIDVQRTDGARSFVDRLRAAGHGTRQLDISFDEFGGPVDVVFANAVFLHLTADQLDLALARALRAVGQKGCWRSPSRKATATRGALQSWRDLAISNTGVSPSSASTCSLPISSRHALGRLEPWLFAICRRTR